MTRLVPSLASQRSRHGSAGVRAGSWAIFVGTAFRGGPPSQFLASKTKPSITPMNLSASQHHHSPIHHSLSVPSHPSSPSHPQPPFIEAPLP